MIGNLAPPSKLTTITAPDGKLRSDIPYARLPRLERLRVSGKIDNTEEKSEDDGDGDEEARSKTREEREKKKMRGKNKSMKRYLRKHRKNVIDPTTVLASYSFFFVCILCRLYRLQYGRSWRSKEKTKGELSLKHLAKWLMTSHLLWIVSNGQDDFHSNETICFAADTLSLVKMNLGNIPVSGSILLHRVVYLSTHLSSAL